MQPAQEQEQYDRADARHQTGVAEPPMLILGAGGAGWTSVEALSAADGVALWAYEPRGVLSDVLCGTGGVFVSIRPARDSYGPARIVALRARDGVEQWRAGPERFRRRLARVRLVCGARCAITQFSLRAAWHTMQSVRLAGYLSLAGEGDLVVACAQAVLFGIEAATGSLRWVAPPRAGQSRGLFAVRGGRVYVNGERSGLQALDARTGAPWWTSAHPRVVLHVAADDRWVYAHGYDPDPGQEVVTTLRAVDGTPIRRFALRQSPGQMAEAQQLVALTASGIVYLLRGSRLCAVRLDDECELWCGERLEGLQKDDQGRPSPVPQGAVAERYLAYAYTACDDAAHACRLHVGAVDLQAGTPLWHWRGPERPLRLPSRHYANIVAAFGNVYVTTSAGTYAFGGDGGRLLWTAPTGFEVIRLAPALAEGERT